MDDAPRQRRRRLTVLVATVGIAAAVGLTAVPFAGGQTPSQGAPYFGFNDDWHLNQSQLELAAAAGSNAIRTGMYWTGVEYKRDEYYWDVYDELYSRALSLGMRPLFVLTNAPCWAAVSPKACKRGNKRDLAQPPAPSEYDEWREFAGLVAQRYPAALGIEVWNEPNLTRFWYPRPKPTRYADVLRAAVEGIHAANPQMPALMAGMVPTRGRNANKLGFKRFLRRVYKAGAAQLTDGIAFHPFAAFWHRPMPIVLGKVESLMASIRGIMSQFGDGAKDIWVTEIGMSTTGRPRGFSEAEQADGLAAMYRILSEMPGVPLVIVHRFLDQNGGNKNWQTGAGVVSTNGVKKPAYCALAAERGFPC
jgi:polysaccharide biosynthesis protein PslG